MRRRYKFIGVAALMLLLGTSGQAWADSVWTVTTSTQGNLSFSWLHAATGGQNGWYWSGTSQSLDGTLNGMWNTSTQLASGITGTLTVGGSGLTITKTGTGTDPITIKTLEITSGALKGDINSTTFGGGFLSYTAHDANSSVVNTGTLFYYPMHFGNSGSNANEVDDTGFSQWGNNWLNPNFNWSFLTTSDFGFTQAQLANFKTVPTYKLGSDIHATRIDVPDGNIVVPLPAATWMALPLLGGLGVIQRVRRRRMSA